ncbi:MAG: hypothetical protein ACI9G1_003362 [Pirellulaceae bacterium]|jgi:hypothetical protein
MLGELLCTDALYRCLLQMLVTDACYRCLLQMRQVLQYSYFGAPQIYLIFPLLLNPNIFFPLSRLPYACITVTA